jgi:hypothetical protein
MGLSGVLFYKVTLPEVIKRKKMRYIFTRLLRSNSAPLPGLPGLLLLLIFGLIGWVVACSPTIAKVPSAQAQPYTFYRYTWTEDSAENWLVPLPEYQIQWVRPAPDGTVYVFGTTDKRLLPYEIRSTSPSILWHLDGRTLEILAERPFTGYRQGWIVEGTADMDSHEAASTNEQYSNCPVTQPPKTPFIPPEPWPSQPPGEGQFWLGDSGLWTALPISGSWRQLALGEKFWWWSEKFDVAEDAMPDLTVTARRLDGDVPSFQVSEATNGYHESFNWAMLIGVELASPGCWEFTGQYKGHQLSFVLWVPPQ